VLVLLGCGLVELALAGALGPGLAGRAGSFLPATAAAVSAGPRPPPAAPVGAPVGARFALPAAAVASSGGVAALAWVAIKVGLLSYGGGFVIVPLMQGDAVHTYHWMSQSQFLNAVALGQVTPGPVVATIAAVGYAAYGIGGGVLAAGIAFAPSFAFVLAGGRWFAARRSDGRARAFLGGAGPAAIGAILGAAIPLAAALREGWQVAVLAAAAAALLIARRGVVGTLLGAGAVGVLAALLGSPLP
jgi:chromate transporter